MSIERLGGHFAVSSLFESYEDRSRVYCYNVERNHFSIEADGRLRLGLGRARFSSAITGEAQSFNFGAVYLGEHNIIAGVRLANRGQDDEALSQNLLKVFSHADTAEIIRVFDEAFENSTFSLRSLFRDEQRKVVNLILAESLTSSAAVYRSVYESQAPLIRFLDDLSIPVPPGAEGLCRDCPKPSIAHSL